MNRRLRGPALALLAASAGACVDPHVRELAAAGAPITYVSNQVGHAAPTTTLRYYAKWIPSQGRRWVEVLDQVDIDAVGLHAGSKVGTKKVERNGSNLQVRRASGRKAW